MAQKTLWLSGFAAVAAVLAQQSGLFSVLKSTVVAGLQPGGVYLVPTNQLLHPWGEQALFRGRPVDMAFDSGKRLLAVLNSAGISIRDGNTGVEIGSAKVRGVSYAGIAFRPGDREVWASETTQFGPDAIVIVPLSESGTPLQTEKIPVEGHAVPAGIAFSNDGSIAYVALSRNNSIALVDVASRKIAREVPVGIAPISVAVQRKTGKVFVINRGGRKPVSSQALAFSSGSAVATDAKTGAPLAGTISVLGADGNPVREIDVGIGPSGLAFSPDEKLLAVTNGHSDTVTFIDADQVEKIAEVKAPVWPDGMLGSQPTSARSRPMARRCL